MSGYSKCPECGAEMEDIVEAQEDLEIQRLLSTRRLVLDRCTKCGYQLGRYRRHVFRPWRDTQIYYVRTSRLDDEQFIEARALEMGPHGQWNDKRHVFSLDELLYQVKLRERIAKYWEEHAEDGYECSSAKYSGGG
jgi:hypothetical protein